AGRSAAATRARQVRQREVVVTIELEVADLAAGLDAAGGDRAGFPGCEHDRGQPGHDDNPDRRGDKKLHEGEAGLASQLTPEERPHRLTLTVWITIPTRPAPGHVLTVIDQSWLL